MTQTKAIETAFISGRTHNQVASTTMETALISGRMNHGVGTNIMEIAVIMMDPSYVPSDGTAKKRRMTSLTIR